MNVHRWSSLFRSYDLTLRSNQFILVMSAAGALAGFFISDRTIGSNLLAAIVAGASVLAAGVLAKELDPDRPNAGPFAAAVTLPLLWIANPVGLVAPFWLLGGVRFINRTTGQAPKPTDTFILLVLMAWLAWKEIPLFGMLMGGFMILDALMPNGRRIHAAVGAVLLIVSGAWLWLGNWDTGRPSLWLAIALLLIAIAVIPIILSYYQVNSVGDATGEPLTPSRVQAGQAIALSAGLFLASWSGKIGVGLLIALWGALLGIIANRLLFNRLRHLITAP